MLNKEVGALQMIIKMLEDVGLEDVADFQNKSLQTPLHLATEDELSEAITMLLSVNASVNIPDKDGDTPVHIAVRKGSVSMLSKLFKNNVRITKTQLLSSLLFLLSRPIPTSPTILVSFPSTSLWSAT